MIENRMDQIYEPSSQIYLTFSSVLRRSGSIFHGDGVNGLKSTKISNNIFIQTSRQSNQSTLQRRKLRRFKQDLTMCFNRKNQNGSINVLESHLKNFKLRSNRLKINQSSKKNKSLKNKTFWLEMSIQRQCLFALMEVKWHLRVCSHGWKNMGIDAWV